MHRFIIIIELRSAVLLIARTVINQQLKISTCHSPMIITQTFDRLSVCLFLSSSLLCRPKPPPLQPLRPPPPQFLMIAPPPPALLPVFSHGTAPLLPRPLLLHYHPPPLFKRKRVLKASMMSLHHLLHQPRSGQKRRRLIMIVWRWSQTRTALCVGSCEPAPVVVPG